MCYLVPHTIVTYITLDSNYICGPLEMWYLNCTTYPHLSHKVEAPAGVGFSYSDNPGVDYNTDDNKTANDNYKFLVNWFSNYSEYINNDFYVTYVHSNYH